MTASCNLVLILALAGWLIVGLLGVLLLVIGSRLREPTDLPMEPLLSEWERERLAARWRRRQS